MFKCKLFLLVLVFIVKFANASNLYFYDAEQAYTIDSIENANFIVFEEAVNNGLNSGVYWLKFDAQSENSSIIQIKNNHIKNVIAYQNSVLVKPVTSNSYLSYEIKKTDYPLFLHILIDKEAFIPIEKFTEEQYFKNETLEALLLGLFYGFVLMVIIVNLFYYFNFQDKSFFYYTIFLLSIAIGMGFTDGLLELLGVSFEILNDYELLAYSLVGLTASVFAVDYLQLKNHYPNLRYTLYLAVLASFILDVIYILTNDFIYAVLSYLSIYYIFVACWAVSLLLFRKYTYAAFFCVAYILLIIFVTAYFLFPALGLPNFGVDMNILKMGGYFEMLIITYAVVLRMHFLQSENNRMHDEILLFTQKIDALSNQATAQNFDNKNYISEFNLSKKENEILNLIVQNKRNKEIASELFISVNTVKFHIKNIYRKLNIKNRKQIHSSIKTL